MAHVKTASAAKMNRDSKPKNLGIKVYAGQSAQPGTIIVRQKGTKFQAGDGTKLGGDYTLFAVRTGVVKFFRRLGKRVVSVV